MNGGGIFGIVIGEIISLVLIMIASFSLYPSIKKIILSNIGISLVFFIIIFPILNHHQIEVITRWTSASCTIVNVIATPYKCHCKKNCQSVECYGNYIKCSYDKEGMCCDGYQCLRSTSYTTCSRRRFGMLQTINSTIHNNTIDKTTPVHTVTCTTHSRCVESLNNQLCENVECTQICDDIEVTYEVNNYASPNEIRNITKFQHNANKYDFIVGDSRSCYHKNDDISFITDYENWKLIIPFIPMFFTVFILILVSIRLYYENKKNTQSTQSVHSAHSTQLNQVNPPGSFVWSRNYRNNSNNTTDTTTTTTTITYNSDTDYYSDYSY